MVSIYLITIGVAWALAQAIKYTVTTINNGRLDVSTILKSGNMPSVHAAVVVALTILIGLKNGTSSGLFALSFLLTAVVAYDAMGVRRATGEQGIALRKLLGSKAKLPYQALGHKPLEVAVGAIVGAVANLIVAFFTPNL